MKSQLSNPLALAVLALTFERPMHPYEMAATLKRRQKHESIKLRYGSLYTVIDLLTARGLIRPKETSRDGKRPERTVYTLTPAGHDALRSWMHTLVAEPAKEFTQFEAALSLLAVLPPDEAVALMRSRALQLTGKIAHLETIVAHLTSQDLAALADPEVALPPSLLATKFPAIFTVELEHRLALLKAELGFVNDLVRRITEDGWGPIETWRGLQQACERNYQRENEGTAEPHDAAPAAMGSK